MSRTRAPSACLVFAPIAPTPRVDGETVVNAEPSAQSSSLSGSWSDKNKSRFYFLFLMAAIYIRSGTAWAQHSLAVKIFHFSFVDDLYQSFPFHHLSFVSWENLALSFILGVSRAWFLFLFIKAKKLLVSFMFSLGGENFTMHDLRSWGDSGLIWKGLGVGWKNLWLFLAMGAIKERWNV